MTNSIEKVNDDDYDEQDEKNEKDDEYGNQITRMADPQIV